MKYNHKQPSADISMTKMWLCVGFDAVCTWPFTVCHHA